MITMVKSVTKLMQVKGVNRVKNGKTRIPFMKDIGAGFGKNGDSMKETHKIKFYVG